MEIPAGGPEIQRRRPPRSGRFGPGADAAGLLAAMPVSSPSMTHPVALLSPFAFPSLRGNAVTVDRIARGLAERGVDLSVWDLSVTPEATVEAEVQAYGPGLIHAFHAYRVGPLALRLARRQEIPLIVTLTGTDANHDLFDPERAPVVRRVLEGASAVVVFHQSIATRIAAALPDLATRLVVVPQAVRLEERVSFDLAARWGLPPERVLFALPAGLRTVKNPRLPLRPFARLVARHPEARLLYAGPILDPDEGDALLRSIDGHSWVRYIGAVPHENMASLLRQVDVVLNCSISEGGMANSVLEALAMSRAVLASDIDGNRSLVEEGVTGLLFHDDRHFEEQAERLVRDPELRARLGRAGRQRVAREFPAERELEGYLAVYRRFVAVPSM
jgi:L-malate glycosyltransferase